MNSGKLAVTLLITLAGSLSVFGQSIDPSLETGLKPYGSYHGGNLDSVSLSNGNLTLHIPLPDYSQRGSLTYGPQLTYNNKGWSVVPNCNSVTGICRPYWNWNGESVSLNSFYGGNGLPSSSWLSADQVFVDWEPSYKGAQTFSFTATTTDGSVHQLAHLPGSGMFTIDGTNIWYDGSQPPTHLQGIARNSQGIDVTDLKDTNGNFFSISNPATLTDTLGRILPSPQSGGTTDFSGCTGPLPIAGAGIRVLPGFNGGTKQIKFCSADVALQTNFQATAYYNNSETTIAEHPVAAANNPMLQSVVLYNGVSWASSPAWTFEYNSRNPGDSASVNYGDLTKITLPTGGTISYTWGTGSTCSSQFDTPTAPLSRVVTSRTVNANDGTGPHTWTYGSGGVTDPAGNDTIHTFTALNGSCSYYETQTKYFQGSSQSGTLLKTVNTDYRWIANPFDTVNPSSQLRTVTQVFPIRITTTWPSGKVTKIEKDYDNNLQITAPSQFTGTYGNVIETREYDYGDGAPGPLVRRTDYTYKAFDGSPSAASYLAFNLVGLVSSVTVYDGNNNQVAKTTYGYDESSLQPSAGTSSITTQHDTSLPNPGTRGNRTSVSHWLNRTGGTLTTSTTYYDTGTPYQVIDALGNTTTNFYGSGFQSGTSFLGAYVTQVQNALQQNTYFDYDFNTGLRTATKDANGQISTWDYDPLNRTLHSNAPDGGSTRWDYTDSQPPSFTATSTITSSLNHVVEADLDGLGRLAQSKLTSDPEGVDLANTTYDAMGRIATVSNPYRSTSDPTYGLTQTQYDALGRVTQVTKQDGSSVSTQYDLVSANSPHADCAMTTDEAGKQRQACSDGLGRLIEVDEPIGVTSASGAASPTASIPIGGALQILNPQASAVQARADSPFVMAGAGDFYYLDINGHVREATEVSNGDWAGWTNGDVTGGAPAASSNSQLAAYRDSSGRTYVLYVTASQHLEVLYYNNGWFSEDLTSTFGNVLPSSGTPFAMGGLGDFYYLDSNGHAREATVLSDGTWAGWTNADVTAATGAPAAGASSRLTAYQDSSGRTYVLYVTAAQHLEVVYYNNGWNAEDLSSTFGGVLANPSTPFAMGGLGDFYYLDSNGHAREATVVSDGTWAGWTNADVTGSAPGAASSSQLAAYRDSSGRTYVLYVTDAQHLEVVYYDNGWSAADLTSAFRGALVSVATPIVMAGPGDFYYLDTNGHAREAAVSNGTWASWTNIDLTGAASAAGSNSGLIAARDAVRTYVLYANTDPHAEALWYDGYNWNNLDLGLLTAGGYDSGTISLTVGGFTVTVCYGHSTNSSCNYQPVNATADEVAAALAQALNVSSSPVTAVASGSTLNVTWKTSSPTNVDISGLTLSHDQSGIFAPSFSDTYATFYTYDALGNLLSVNQKGDGSQPARVRTFTYDSLSRLLTANNPESGTISYSYDPNGNLLQKTSPQANQTAAATQTISYCYDALNRVTGKAYSAQTCQNGQLPSGTAVVSYFYDQSSYQNLTIAYGIGRLTGTADQAGTGAYSFDKMGRIKTEQRSIGGVTRTMSYGYNLDGSLNQVTYPSGAAVIYTLESAGSNTSGRMLSAVDTSHSINYAISTTYTPAGSVAGFSSGGTITNSFTYNKRLQPINVSATGPAGTVFSLTYDFHLGAGNNGNVYGITNNKDNSRNQTFAYDGLNRLISAQNAGTDCSQGTVNGKSKFWGNTYNYDAWGNLTDKNKTRCAAEDIHFIVDAHNQLHVPKDQSGQPVGADYTYDAAGNMLYDANAAQNYSYDQENRISGSRGYTYTYDADSNRVKKTSGSTGTLYWYMSPGIVAESDLNGNLTSEYVFFNGERVARRDNPSGASPTVVYYFSDHLKTTDIVTDATGHILNESDYYPWGGELQFANADSNHYKFTGKERDSETGLDYFGARYYSNGLGRFITPDWSATPVPVPYADLNDPQSLNQYSYVRNLPTVRVDSDGHCCWDEIKSLLVGAAKEVHNWAADTASHGVPFIPGAPGTMPLPAAVGESTGLTGMGPGPGGAGNAQPVIETPSNGMETAGMVTTRYAPLVLAVVGAIKGGAPEGEGVGAGSRLPQDINVNPRAPAANNGNGTVGPSSTQNAAAQGDAAAAQAAGHTDIRMNQQQVNAQGQRVGLNRPDLQSTDANGVRHYTEYDRSAQNAADHHARTQANDPNGVTHTNIGP